MTAKTLHSEEVRARERRQKIRTILWWLPSLFLHLALIGVVGYFGYQKLVEEISKEEAEKPPADLDEETYEQLSENIESVRFNELLKQLQDLQIILHNMDVLKNEFAKTFDEFAEAEAKQAQEDNLVQELFDRAIALQNNALTDQGKVADAAIPLAQKMQGAEADPAAASSAMRQDLNTHFFPAYDRIHINQADAQNALDRIVNEARLIGLNETAAKTEEVRELQLQANQKQTETHRNLEGTVHNLTRFPEVARNISEHEKRRQSALNDVQKFTELAQKLDSEARRLRQEAKATEATLATAKAEEKAKAEALAKAQKAFEEATAKATAAKQKVADEKAAAEKAAAEASPAPIPPQEPANP